MQKRNEDGLTPNMIEFCNAVVSGLSLSDAYRKAYKAGNMKANSINVNASKLMADTNVSLRVISLREKVNEAFVIKESDLLRESARVAFSDVRRLYHDDGKVKLPHELDDDTAHAVSGFEIDEYGRIKYKFWPKGEASERLFKAGGLYAADNKQKAPVINIARIELVAAVKPAA